jgi:hypothetical protein
MGAEIFDEKEALRVERERYREALNEIQQAARVALGDEPGGQATTLIPAESRELFSLWLCHGMRGPEIDASHPAYTGAMKLAQAQPHPEDGDPGRPVLLATRPNTDTYVSLGEVRERLLSDEAIEAAMDAAARQRQLCREHPSPTQCGLEAALSSAFGEDEDVPADVRESQERADDWGFQEGSE